MTKDLLGQKKPAVMLHFIKMVTNFLSFPHVKCINRK